MLQILSDSCTQQVVSGFLHQNKAADTLLVISIMVTCKVRGTYNARAVEDLMESEVNSKILVEVF